VWIASATSISDNDSLDTAIEKNGFAIVRQVVPHELLNDLETSLPENCSNFRNGFDSSPIFELARCDAIRRVVTPVLGEKCFAVRAIFFNKTPSSNWKVVWHQDCVIPVKDQCRLAGWGPWSVKSGVPHVRPPAGVLDNMLAVRIHLDDCDTNNGPLRVLPGTHLKGILSDEEIAKLPRLAEVTCSVAAGDVLLMRPLLVHASSASHSATARRVVHIEYAAEQLPLPAVWNDQIM
jgi:ectoine hydroxylase-related dioxygenase (phytanoyl-CoA dioxygenase family)